MHMLDPVNFLAAVGLGVKIMGVLTAVQVLRSLWWLVNMILVQPPFDPLQHLPGPDAAKFQNHFREVMDPELSPQTHAEWVKNYGKTFRFHGFGSFDYRLMSFDMRSISHVLNSPIFEKPWQTRRIVTRLVGRGVFATEGEEHKHLRKLIGPAFTKHSVRAQAPIFFQKTEELRDCWDNIISSSCTPSGAEKGAAGQEAIIDVAHWVTRATFDVIGLAGFDYAFHSLQDETEEVYLAYRKMFNVADQTPDARAIANLFFPTFEWLFPDRGTRQVNESLRIIRKAGSKLIADKKAAIIAEKTSTKDIQEKDLLSLLLKANLSEDPAHRLSDLDILDQLSNFLFAGSDSTSLAIAWCLHFLAIAPDVQARLRDELSSSCPPSPSSTCSVESHDAAASAALDQLPFLDAVVREALRLTPPAHGTIRVATSDTRIPVSEPVTLRSGEVVNEVLIKKGSYVHIPIEGLSHSKDIWGPNAHEFIPERWFDLPEPARNHPGLAGLMSFTFGPHACPAWRFSIMEIKMFIAGLIPHFNFAPAAEIRKYNHIVTRPFVDDKFELGAQLPLRVSRYEG